MGRVKKSFNNGGDNLIDIHSHITFGLDDGAQSLEESIDMAKQAVSEGISTIIATPHHRHPSYNNPNLIVKKQITFINEQLQAAQIPLKVLSGQEIRLFGELPFVLESCDELLTLGESKMILIEFPSYNIPHYTEKLFYDLLIKGFIPIIAHPELNDEIVKYPDKLYQLIKNGAFSQVTAASVAGVYGRKIQHLSLQMIEYQLTHFIGSDAHNLKSRGFKWVKAWSTVDKKLGKDFVDKLDKQAKELVSLSEVNKQVPEPIPKRYFT